MFAGNADRLNQHKHSVQHLDGQAEVCRTINKRNCKAKFLFLYAKMSTAKKLFRSIRRVVDPSIIFVVKASLKFIHLFKPQVTYLKPLVTIHLFLGYTSLTTLNLAHFLAQHTIKMLISAVLCYPSKWISVYMKKVCKKKRQRNIYYHSLAINEIVLFYERKDSSKLSSFIYTSNCSATVFMIKYSF